MAHLENIFVVDQSNIQCHLGAVYIGGEQGFADSWKKHEKQLNTQYLENKDVKLCSKDKSK